MPACQRRALTGAARFLRPRAAKDGGFRGTSTSGSQRSLMLPGTTGNGSADWTYCRARRRCTTPGSGVLLFDYRRIRRERRPAPERRATMAGGCRGRALCLPHRQAAAMSRRNRSLADLRLEAAGASLAVRLCAEHPEISRGSSWKSRQRRFPRKRPRRSDSPPATCALWPAVPRGLSASRAAAYGWQTPKLLMYLHDGGAPPAEVVATRGPIRRTTLEVPSRGQR